MIKPIPRKYLRFYTNATYLGRTSERAPYEFQVNYKALDGSDKKTFLKLGPPFEKTMSLIRDKEYRLHLRWNQERGCFDILKIYGETENKPLGTKGQFVLKEGKMIVKEDESYYYGVKGSIDGIDMEGISYSAPSMKEGLIEFLPLNLPKMVEGEILEDVSYEIRDGRKFLIREAGCLLRFPKTRSYIEEEAKEVLPQ